MTYSLIIKKIIKTENNFINYNYKYDGVDCIFKIAFNNMLNQDLNIKNKYKFFIETLNVFYIKGTKEEEFINYFCKIQKTYNILNRFAHNYKYKKSNIVVNTDIGLNELIPNSKNVICIFHKNARYLFHVKDLICIINTSLTNSHMFFSEPLPIKNPYNNLPFDKSTLYNIYFFIRYKTNYHCDLLLKFFDCDFNLTIFKGKNEYLLRELSINNYVYKSTSQILENEILDMISFYNDNYCGDISELQIFIDKEFPKDKLIKIFQPYLLMFFSSQYSFLNHKKKETLYYFKQGLRRFKNFNPQFGRKKYKIIFKHTKNFKKKVVGKIIEFDDIHVKFNNIEKDNKIFLSDHLNYEEINYNSSNNLSFLNNRMPLFFREGTDENTNYESIEDEHNAESEHENEDENEESEHENEDENEDEEDYEDENEEQEEDEQYYNDDGSIS